MFHHTFFVTGTDTGVGKTVLTALLARHLCQKGVKVAAFKPLCSGNRNDARALQRAISGALSLDEVNPWHFRASLTPLLAARQERMRVRLDDVCARALSLRQRFEVVLIEGAGGLLSPLGEGFTARELIIALRAAPIIVCPNRLGAINQTLLVLSALPAALARRARVVLVSPRHPDNSSRSNRRFLAEMLGPKRVQAVPWLADLSRLDRALSAPRLRQSLDAVLASEFGFPTLASAIE
jgi:dethiobiotin synthetase